MHSARIYHRIVSFKCWPIMIICSIKPWNISLYVQDAIKTIWTSYQIYSVNTHAHTHLSLSKQEWHQLGDGFRFGHANCYILMATLIFRAQKLIAYDNVCLIKSKMFRLKQHRMWKIDYSTLWIAFFSIFMCQQSN